ncbi:hypothetical protein LEMLEM_LOCUS41 [Lemmus lemmus]
MTSSVDGLLSGSRTQSCLAFERVCLCSFETFPGTLLCRPGWLRTHRDTPASASQVLGLKG